MQSEHWIHWTKETINMLIMISAIKSVDNVVACCSMHGYYAILSDDISSLCALSN